MSDAVIQWLPWGEAAFAQARAEKKPILLHIGATWCHWCHVMDQTTWTHHPAVALVRERFVAVRVDTDQRPDVNDRYNQGGWPTIAVLDADGEVLAGRLYMPPHEVVPLLESCSTPGQRWVLGKSSAPDLLDAPADVEATWAAVKKAFDPYHAGFGELEKFPHPGVLDWLADRVGRGVDDGGMLARTLDAMVEKGLFDPFDGGFFRYATQDDWSEVHYEKLGEDQARLLRVYLRTGRKQPAAERSVAWLVRHLWRDDVGAFGASMDADEGYYHRPHRDAPPPLDLTVYAAWNAQIAATLLLAAVRWDRPGLGELALTALCHVRDQLVRADGAVLRSVGGFAGLLEDQAAVADAFAKAGQYTGDEAWFTAAARLLAFAETLALKEGGFRDRPAGGEGLLAHARRLLPPNAALGEAAWRLHALTDDPRWKDLAAAASAGATVEADRYGFMAAPAAALAERLGRPAVVVKVHGDDGLFRDAVALGDPEVLVRRAESGVPAGRALACSGRACARPVATAGELRGQIEQLRRG